MKKLFLLFLIFPLQFPLLKAQTYHPLVETRKLWSTYHLILPNPPLSDYTKFEGDTTIGLYTYKKVWVSYDAEMTQWYNYGLIREDLQKKVFYTLTYPVYEFLMYDFGANPGDTLMLHGNPYPYVLDSVGTCTLLSGEQRRTIMLHYTWYPCSETWIEGIGSSTFGVLNGGMCGAVGDSHSMLCAWENDTLKYHGPAYHDCFIIDGIISHSLNDQMVRVYPNPASDVLTVYIESGSNAGLHIGIQDLAGRVCIEQVLDGRETLISLKKANLSKGLYIYHISSGNAIIHAGRLTIL
jgi:hypothetical protein